MTSLLQATKGAAAGNIPRAPKKFNLLIAFDAFETLYAPKEPVHKTYGQFARDNGLKHASDDVVAKYLHDRITTAAKEYPNYGKHVKGMTPEGWWMKVIKNIFTDVEPTLSSPSHQPQLDDLGRRLFHHFSTRDAYKTATNMPGLLQSLKHHHTPTKDSAINHVVLGVISNSDDRVSGILSSLGLTVSPLRFQRESKSDPHFASAAPLDGKAYDVDFTVMSYDVEESKPHRVMWQAGEMLARRSVVHELGEKRADEMDMEGTPWLKVYVGDDVKKDVESAWGVGWNAVLLKEFIADQPKDGRLEDLERVLDNGVVEVLGGPKPRMFTVNKLETLVEWIVKRGLEAPAGFEEVNTSDKMFKLVNHME